MYPIINSYCMLLVHLTRIINVRPRSERRTCDRLRRGHSSISSSDVAQFGSFHKWRPHSSWSIIGKSVHLMFIHWLNNVSLLCESHKRHLQLEGDRLVSAPTAQSPMDEWCIGSVPDSDVLDVFDVIIQICRLIIWCTNSSWEQRGGRNSRLQNLLTIRSYLKCSHSKNKWDELVNWN